MKLYIAVTADELELPIFVSDNIRDMAKRFNQKENSIMSKIAHKSSGRNSGVRFMRVEVEDE